MKSRKKRSSLNAPEWLGSATGIYPHLAEHRRLITSDGIDIDPIAPEAKHPAFALWLRWVVFEATNQNVSRFASNAGINQAALRRICMGESEPTPSTMLKIQAAAWNEALVKAELNDLWALIFPARQIPPWKGRESLKLQKDGMSRLCEILNYNLGRLGKSFIDVEKEIDISRARLSLFLMNLPFGETPPEPEEVAKLVRAFGGKLKSESGEALDLPALLKIIYEGI